MSDMFFNKPRLYIRDKDDVVQDSLDPTQYYDSSLEFFLKGKVSVLSFKVLKDDDSYKLLTTASNVSFVYENQSYWLTFMIVEQDEYELSVVAYPLGLEFNNEDKGPYKATAAQTFAFYFNTFVYGKQIVIGINEVSAKKLTLEWEGTESGLARLYSLANSFQAELEFTCDLNNDGSLKTLKCNVYAAHTDTVQGIGTDRRNETFYQGIEIKTVKKREDKTALATAVSARGKDGLTISKLTKEVKDSEGKLLYCTYAKPTGRYSDVTKVYAAQAVDNFPSLTNSSDKWTVRDLGESQFATAEGLYGYMLGELKKIDHPEIEWTIEGYIDGRIGDTVRVRNDKYKPALFLDARIVGQKLDWDRPEASSTTFSNVNVLEPKLDEGILSKMQALIEAAKTYTATIETTNGVNFIDGVGETKLFAMVRDGVVDITSSLIIKWYKDGIFLEDALFVSVTPSDLTDNKAVYSYEVYDLNGKYRNKAEATVTNILNGSQGVDGKTSYIHRAFSWSADGSDRFTIPYPSLNLLSNSALKDFSDWTFNAALDVTVSDGVMSVTAPTTPNGSRYTIDQKRKELLVVPNGVYSNSIEVWVDPDATNLNGTAVFARPNEYASGEDDISVITIRNEVERGSWIRLSATSSTNVTSEGTYFNMYGIYLSGNMSGTIKFRKPKFELSDMPTVYTPRPEEDYNNAYPQYSGIYTDTNEIGSDDPKKYEWSMFRGEQGKPGDKGQSLFTWIMYADDAEGNGISPSPNGKKYMGMAPNKTDPNFGTDPKAYIWNPMYDEAALNEIEKNIQGIPRVYIQSSQPTDPRNGDQWWVMSNNEVTAFKVYGNMEWRDQVIDQNFLNIKALNAVNIVGSTITGSVVQNSFTGYQEDGASLSGFVRMQGARVQSQYSTDSGSQTGSWDITPKFINSRINWPDGSLLSGYQLSHGEFKLQSNPSAGNGNKIKYDVGLGIEELVPQTIAVQINLAKSGSSERVTLYLTRYMKTVTCIILRSIKGSYNGSERGQCGVTGSAWVTNNQLPIQLRPQYEVAFEMMRNVGSGLTTSVILHVGTDGKIYHTNPDMPSSNAVCTGSSVWTVPGGVGSFPLS